MRPTMTEALEATTRSLRDVILPALTDPLAQAQVPPMLYCLHLLASDWAAIIPNLMRDNDALERAFATAVAQPSLPADLVARIAAVLADRPAESRYPDYAELAARNERNRALAAAILVRLRSLPSSDTARNLRSAIREALAAGLERDSAITRMPNERTAEKPA